MTQMNFLQNRNRLTDIVNRLMVAWVEGVWGGMDWEFGIGKYKLVHIQWTTNKVLLIAQGMLFNIL